MVASRGFLLLNVPCEWQRLKLWLNFKSTQGCNYTTWIKHAIGAWWHCLSVRTVRGSDIWNIFDSRWWDTIVLDCQCHLDTRIQPIQCKPSIFFGHEKVKRCKCDLFIGLQRRVLLHLKKKREANRKKAQKLEVNRRWFLSSCVGPYIFTTDILTCCGKKGTAMMSTVND